MLISSVPGTSGYEQFNFSQYLQGHFKNTVFFSVKYLFHPIVGSNYLY